MNPGERITASIRLVRLLGQGGMGSVWIAEHERLKTQVVVKFIVGEYAAHPEALARFEREATLAAQAKSPHVVQVFDHGIAENGLPYIAMEYLEGEDLATRIEREGRLQPSVFAEWFRQACSGLGRAHSKNIVHRDIKPENIFLCNEDGDVLVKLLDFGIAKSDSVSGSFSGTKTGAFLGTAYYMSPEQTMGAKTIDLRTDLWAMGVVAYYALTGVRPFDGDAIGALVMAITSGEVPPPSSHVPELPASVDAWMQKALAKNPAERFQSAREMASALTEAVTGRVILGQSGDFGVPAPSAAGPAPNPSRRATTLSPAVATQLVITGNETSVELPVKKSPRGWVLGAAALVSVAAGILWLRPSSPADGQEPLVAAQAGEPRGPIAAAPVTEAAPSPPLEPPQPSPTSAAPTGSVGSTPPDSSEGATGADAATPQGAKPATAQKTGTQKASAKSSATKEGASRPVETTPATAAPSPAKAASPPASPPAEKKPASKSGSLQMQLE